MRFLPWLCLPILTMILVSSSGWSQQRAPRLALVIGNAAYPDASTPLSTSIPDASALAAELTRSGFEVDLKKNLGRADMQSSIDAFTGKIKPGATVLVYFSGFGVQVAKQNYLIPVNADPWNENTVKKDGISVDGVMAEINRKGAKVKVLILDGARRNPSRSDFANVRRASLRSMHPRIRWSCFRPCPAIWSPTALERTACSWVSCSRKSAARTCPVHRTY